MSFRIEGAPPPSASPEAAPQAKGKSPDGTPSSFETTLRSLASRVDAGEALVRRAVQGGGPGGLEPRDWIALQAGIYRYVEALDLAGKLVDRAGNAVRTLLQAGH